MEVGIISIDGEVEVSLTGTVFSTVVGCTSVGGNAGHYRCPGVAHVDVHGSPEDDSVYGEWANVSFDVDGGAGDDWISTGPEDDDIEAGPGRDEVFGDFGDDLIDGGDGDDNLMGYAGDDVLFGRAGSDTLSGDESNDTLFGGDGDDHLWGDERGETVRYSGHGDDTLTGGNGNDELYPQGGTDVVRGGAGVDGANYVEYVDPVYGTSSSIRVTLDWQANDGPPGDGDSIGPDGDVEDLSSPGASSAESVVLVGNNVANVLETRAARDTAVVLVDGGGGPDTLISGGGSGPAFELIGGLGDDVIQGSAHREVITGGAGSDTITADGGIDIVEPGRGQDNVDGGSGDDTIDAGDGEVDQVRCGPGDDVARVDRIDIVETATSVCETLVLSGSAPDVAVPSRTRYRVGPRGLARVVLTNDGSFSVDVDATARWDGALLGKGEATLAAQARRGLGLQLTRAARAEIRRTGSIRAQVTFRLVSGSQAATVKRTVRFTE